MRRTSACSHVLLLSRTVQVLGARLDLLGGLLPAVLGAGLNPSSPAFAFLSQDCVHLWLCTLKASPELSPGLSGLFECAKRTTMCDFVLRADSPGAELSFRSLSAAGSTCAKQCRSCRRMLSLEVRSL